jgi:hypothetical protein
LVGQSLALAFLDFVFLHGINYRLPHTINMSKPMDFGGNPTDPAHVPAVSEHQYHVDVIHSDEKNATAQDIEDMKRMGKKQLFRVNPPKYSTRDQLESWIDLPEFHQGRC